MSYGCLISNIKLLDGLALKKRTSGPVNAYLTPGPGIYILMLLHMYIAHEQGQKNPLGTNIDANKKPLLLCQFAAGFKTISLKSDFLPFFMCFFSHVFSPRQGQTTHWQQKFYGNRKDFSLCPCVASFKMISSKSDFYTHF